MPEEGSAPNYEGAALERIHEARASLVDGDALAEETELAARGGRLTDRSIPPGEVNPGTGQPPFSFVTCGERSYMKLKSRIRLDPRNKGFLCSLLL